MPKEKGKDTKQKTTTHTQINLCQLSEKLHKVRTEPQAKKKKKT
jgi:hypothetical protein